EAEFAFRIGRDLPPLSAPYGIETVMDAVDRLHVAIEVPDSRFTRFARAGAPQLVADDACANLFVLGPAAAAWRHLDLATHAVAVSKNGGLVARGTGANVLEDPRRALTWLANDRVKRGDLLRAGQVVTTGTCVVPVVIAPGDVVRADFGELGSVEVRFVD